MKHLILSLLIFFLSSCTQTPKEEHFVNPMFYRQMRPMGYRDFWSFTINPTSVHMENDEGDFYIDKCEMTENSYYFVTLKCTQVSSPEGVELDTENTYSYRFIFLPYKDNYWGRLPIFIAYYFNNEKDPFMTRSYVIDATEEEFNANEINPYYDRHWYLKKITTTSNHSSPQ